MAVSLFFVFGFCLVAKADFFFSLFQLLLGNQSGQIRLFDTREIKTFREASVEAPHLR